MMDRLLLIGLFAATVGFVYAISMFTTPHRGMMKVVERTAAGAAICFACYLLLYPFGIKLAQTPFAALCAGYLGLPGVAFSAFVSGLP